MDNESQGDFSPPTEGAEGSSEETKKIRTSRIGNWLETLARLGLGELATRIGTNILLFILLVAVAVMLRTLFRSVVFGQNAEAGETIQEATPLVSIDLITESAGGETDSISRETRLHTTIPTRPRIDVITYTVQPGDNVFSIAEKFGLNPKTILWGNYYTLRDDPHSLRIGQELNILPVDGTYYEWQGTETETLTGVAKYFGVDPEIIINFPGNHLDPDTIGDYANPNISPGTWLVIPGGSREFTSWSAPIGVTRDNPAVARVIGSGACGAISGGAVGYGTFVWPTVRHYLSGYDYSPDTNHRGIDIDGETGEAVFATDAGVIVYAGWNDYGYGYMIMVDHGNGWQSLYAHLSAINVVCGESVGQGQVIGAIGSTGNSSGSHLHFELMNTQYGKVNPWNFLPPP